MPIFYGGGFQEKRMWGFTPYLEQPASEKFVEHYHKYLLLDFISKNAEEYDERAQAIKELELCERTLYRWKLHPNWIGEVVLPQVERLKKMSITELTFMLAGAEE